MTDPAANNLPAPAGQDAALARLPPAGTGGQSALVRRRDPEEGTGATLQKRKQGLLARCLGSDPVGVGANHQAVG